MITSELSGAFEVRRVSFLPTEKTYPASDIETREQVKIPSGEMIHIMQYGGVLLVSDEAYNKLIHQSR